MAWFYLLVAGLLEVTWAVGLKFTNGFSRLIPSLLVIAAICVSLYLLSRAVMTIPVGTAYAIWTGIGAAGTALIGMLLLGESRELIRLVCIGAIVLGVLGLKFASGD